MKKVILLIMLSVIVSSCSKEEKDYRRKKWEYKTKNLELDYLDRISAIRDRAEAHLLIMKLDSLKEEIDKY